MTTVALWRVVEHQSEQYEYRATSTTEMGDVLHDLIEESKPTPYCHEWHDLIATSFRYPLPVEARFEARFRPAGSMKNVLYASEYEETTLYEHGYYFFKLRIGVEGLPPAGSRTIFSPLLRDRMQAVNLYDHPQVDEITDPHSHTASHSFVRENSDVAAVRYPSCRDPERRPNYVILDIRALEKRIGTQKPITFSYNRSTSTLHWKDYKLALTPTHFGLG